MKQKNITLQMRNKIIYFINYLSTSESMSSMDRRFFVTIIIVIIIITLFRIHFKLNCFVFSLCKYIL